LKKSFKTPRGRVVFDGGGIDPDIKTETPYQHAFIQLLVEDGFIFDFATYYVSNHKTAPDPRKFGLANEDYQLFVSWMKDKDYSYTSELESKLDELDLEAKKERYYSELKTNIEQIKSKVGDNRRQGLMLHKDRIKMLLEEEIVSRFHLDKGRIESQFKYDEDVKTAIKVLGDHTEYLKTLNIQ
jgi:carboxyl-terminal processing protease